MTTLLVLVPTEFELNRLEPQIVQSLTAADGLICVCGFGPVAAGIRTTQLLAQHKPKAAVLIGIAGALSRKMTIGSAATFSHVGCYGVGAGSGSNFRTSSELGWSSSISLEGQPTMGDVIELQKLSKLRYPTSGMLLTVCSASDGRDDVTHRLTKFPQAVAEDMEAYSVAMACGLNGIPLTIIRGISNEAGDRNKARWDVNGALTAAAECFNSLDFQ